MHKNITIITNNSGGSRIFPKGVRQLPNLDYFTIFFAEICMKMKEFGPGGVSMAPPLRSANEQLSLKSVLAIIEWVISSRILLWFLWIYLKVWCRWVAIIPSNDLNYWWISPNLERKIPKLKARKWDEGFHPPTPSFIKLLMRWKIPDAADLRHRLISIFNIRISVNST